MMLRPEHPANSTPPDQPIGHGSVPGHRLNLLLSCAPARPGSSFDQLPSLLGPMGIRSIQASSGEEAADVIRSTSVHIAVVDVSVPLARCCPHAKPSNEDGGTRVLQLLRRLETPPPTIVVRPSQPITRDSARGLTQALRDGAFAVLDQPVGLEAMLEVLRRILRRHYADLWPR